jgi:hypothetical protein
MTCGLVPPLTENVILLPIFSQKTGLEKLETFFPVKVLKAFTGAASGLPSLI